VTGVSIEKKGILLIDVLNASPEEFLFLIVKKNGEKFLLLDDLLSPIKQ
jgi:hypothetical protein